MTLVCNNCQSEGSIELESRVMYQVFDMSGNHGQGETVEGGCYVCTECYDENTDLTELCKEQ